MKIIKSVCIVLGGLYFFWFCANPRSWTEYEVAPICFSGGVWANNQFLMVGNNSGFLESYIETSIDGVTWTEQAIPIMNATSIKWLNSQYVISFNKYSYDKTSFLVSSDGVTWIQIADTVDLNYFKDYIWDGSKYIAVGEKGFVSTSPDLATWTKTALFDSSITFHSIYYLNNHYFARGWSETTKTASDGSIYIENGPTRYFISQDGLQWNEAVIFNGDSLVDIISGNNEYVAFGVHGKIFTSTDGQHWVDHSIFLGPDILSMDWNGADYVATIYNNGNLEIWNTNDFGLWSSYVYYKSNPSLFSSSTYHRFNANLNGNGVNIVLANFSDSNTGNCTGLAIVSH